MADVPVRIFRSERVRSGTSPSIPSYSEDEEPIVENPPGSGGGITLFKLLGDVTDRDFIGKNGYVPVVVGEGLLTLQPLPQVPDNGLISGGIVQWTGTGYIFNVSSSFYRIGGEPYSTDPAQKTLSTPDVTNNRIDVFAVDINNAVVVIEGTPSATPVKPQIDPSTQIELTSVIVTASTTEPTLTEEVIYDENVEWTGTSSGTGTVNFASAVDPYQGSVSVETTDIQNGFYIQFDNGTPVDVSVFQTLGFQLKLKSSMPANQNITGVFLDNSGNPASSSFTLSFDKSSTSYQFVGLVLSSLIFSDLDARYLRFTFNRSGGSPTYSGYFLDIIKLEGGINPPLSIGSFLGLTDTPASYTGQGGKAVAVKSDESGLEFVAGGGGASTFLGLTDTPSSYVGQGGLFPRVNVGETALIFDSVSPYDLDQEGATDGQVLTWVNANNRYEPVTPSGGSSLWTAGSGFIYRDSPVAIGATSLSPTDLTLYLKNKNTGKPIFQVDNFTGSNVFDILDSGRVKINGSGLVGGNGALTVQNTSSATNSIAFRVLNSAGGGILAFTQDLFDLVSNRSLLTGNSGVPGGAGVLKVVNNSASVSSRIFELYQGASARLFVLGDRFLWEIPYFAIGNPSSQLTNGTTIKGGVSTATGIFRVDNSSNQSCFEIRGNRQILMAGLPTTDPAVVGSLWNDAGTLKISI